MLEDSKIIALLWQRSEQGLAALAEKYGSACGKIAANILGSSRDAEECVNDTWLAVWNAVPPQRPDPLRSYVYRLARNISVARYHTNTAAKRNSSYDAALSELEDCLAAAASVEQELSARELTRQIDSFLAALGERDRMLFVRRYWYADSISNLAGRFDMTRDQVSVRLFRIRGRLRTHLKKEGFAV